MRYLALVFPFPPNSLITLSAPRRYSVKNAFVSRLSLTLLLFLLPPVHPPLMPLTSFGTQSSWTNGAPRGGCGGPFPFDFAQDRHRPPQPRKSLPINPPGRTVGIFDLLPKVALLRHCARQDFISTLSLAPLHFCYTTLCTVDLYI